MDVCFATRSLHRQCNEKDGLVSRWGPSAAASIGRTLQELAALDHLGDVAGLLHVNVSGDPSGKLVVRSSDGCWITLEIGDDGAVPGSGLDEIRSVVVVDVAVTTIKKGNRSDA